MGDQRPFFPFRFGFSGTTRTATVPPAAVARRPSRTSSIDIDINPSPSISPTPTEQQLDSQLRSTDLSPKSPTSGNIQIAIFTSPSPSLLPGSPQRASQNHFPSPPTQESPKKAPNESDKGGQPISPSKDSRTTVQEQTVAADKDRPDSVVSKQDSPAKLGTEYEGDNADKGRAIKGTSFEHDVVEAMSSISSQIADTRNIARDPERTADKTLTQSDKKPDEVKEVTEVVQEMNTEGNGEIKTEAKEVKEVVQETNAEANEEIKTEAKEVKDVVQEMNTEANEAIKTEACGFLIPKSGNETDNNENTEIPKPDQMQKQKQDDPDTKEFPAASFPMVKPANNVPQPQKSSSSSSTISDGHNKSVPQDDDHSLQQDIRNYISRFVNRMASGDLKSSVYEKPVSVIALSGQNDGASMQIGLDPSETEGYNSGHDQSIDAATDRDGISAEEMMEDIKAMEDQPEAYVNNNAQGINNSIVFDGSITERNPGVHMAVVTSVNKEPIQSADIASSIET